MGWVSTHTRWRGRRRERDGGMEGWGKRGRGGWIRWTLLFFNRVWLKMILSPFENSLRGCEGTQWPATKTWTRTCDLMSRVYVLQLCLETQPWGEKTDWLCVPLMPFRYAEAPQGQREVSCKTFEIPNTRTCANNDTLILSLSASFPEVRANPWSSTVYAFNKAFGMNAISHAYKHTREMREILWINLAMP